MSRRVNQDALSPGGGRSAPAWRLRLVERLRRQAEGGLLRRAEPAPAGLIDLSSNDYLSLRRRPEIAEAVARAAREEGVGAGASRLAGGTTEAHARLEARVAEWKGSEAALFTPTGYLANLALLSALPQNGDLLLQDKLNHASLIDGARLAVGAAGRGEVILRTFPHRDAERAHEIASAHLRERPESTVWIVTDSVFSMDGDCADLGALGRLRDELNAGGAGGGGGACLIVDEAHATGVLGPTGAGLDEACGHVADICVSTASKALGSLGGFISGAREVVDAVVNFARPFIYTTAAPPTQVAAVEAALTIVEREPELRARLAEVSRVVRTGLIERGWDVRPWETDPTPIVPLVVGGNEEALALSAKLRAAGFLAPAIRPPSVPVGGARVRVSLRATLDDKSIDRLMSACAR